MSSKIFQAHRNIVKQMIALRTSSLEASLLKATDTSAALSLRVCVIPEHSNPTTTLARRVTHQLLVWLHNEFKRGALKGSSDELLGTIVKRVKLPSNAKLIMGVGIYTNTDSINVNGSATAGLGAEIEVDLPSHVAADLPRYLQDLAAKLHDVVRHELGHIYEPIKNPGTRTTLMTDDNLKNITDYFFDPEEIKQWTAGIVALARKRRMKIDDAIEVAIKDITGGIFNSIAPEIREPELVKLRHAWKHALALVFMKNHISMC